MALVDALGTLVRVLLLPGQSHGMKGVALLIRGVSCDALRADKAFDADWPLQDLDQRGATAVIPPDANLKIQRGHDSEIYKWRGVFDRARIRRRRPAARSCLGGGGNSRLA